MNDIDLKRLIKDDQDSIRAPEELKDKTVDYIAEATPKSTGSSTSSKPKRRFPKFAPIAAAACFIALALAIAVPNLELGKRIYTDDFSVRAYAASSNSILEYGDDEKIVFDRKFPWTGLSDQYESEGHYTGCLFSIEGEGIKNVTASTSKGVLYRYTYEEFRVSDEPDRWFEALNWKPSSRGLGEYYRNYDEVEPTFLEEGLKKDDPNQLVQVRLSKKLGSTVSLSRSETDLDKLHLGFWTNDPYDPEGDITGNDDYGPVIDLFNGETLTVTVEFEDGRFSTQIIELHSAFFELAEGNNESGDVTDARIIPKVLNESDIKSSSFVYRSLYGTVTESNDKPFPGTLKQVNEFEFIVDEPYQFDEAPEIDYDENGNPVFDEIDLSLIKQPGETVTRHGRNANDDDASILDIVLTGVSRVENVPEYISLDYETLGNDLEYFNVFNESMRGFTVDENRNLTDTHSCVVVDLEVTNTQDRICDRVPLLGEIVDLVDDQGTINNNRKGWYLCQGLIEEGDQFLKTEFQIDAHETKQVKAVFIFSNEYLDRSDLLYVIDPEDGAFSLTSL